MQIVIDIPECYYEYCKAQEDAIEIQLAVKNGTPLPKGPGRLIDADAVYDDFEKGEYDFEESLEFAPTIIPADKESENEQRRDS